MQYRAVIFDLFGTLVYSFSTQDHARQMEEMARLLGVSPKDFAEQWGATRRERETGRIAAIADNVRRVAEPLNARVTEDQVDSAVRWYTAFARAAFRPREDAVSTLRKIRNAGFSLISDCGPQAPGLWASSPLDGLVDVTVFSCLAGLKKPDPRIYREACRQLGVNPAECLYIGDGSSRELTGASVVGMTAVQVEAVPKGNSLVIDGESWSGKRIESLGEVLGLI